MPILCLILPNSHMSMMTDTDEIAARLLDDLEPHLTPGSGLTGHPTPIPRLTAWTSTRPTPPTSAVFEPMFYAVLRGAKMLTMGVNRFRMTPGTCAASSFGLPYSHELVEATPDRPYVGLCLLLDADLLARIVADMPPHEDRWTCAVAAGDLDGVVGEAFSHLVALLRRPEDVDLLAPLREAELYYRLLQSPMGDTLRQVVQRSEHVRQIKAAADWLGTHNDRPVAISDLAASAGMSVTSFHRHFKAVTGHSPLAFQRHLRLLEARKLLSTGKISVAAVAYEVGYQSAAQFSREYKSMFGVPPTADRRRPQPPGAMAA